MAYRTLEDFFGDIVGKRVGDRGFRNGVGATGGAECPTN